MRDEYDVGVLIGVCKVLSGDDIFFGDLGELICTGRSSYNSGGCSS